MAVNAALFLAFVDPELARQLLTDLEPEVTGLLGRGGVGRVSLDQWLKAWALADPDHAAELLKTELENPRGKNELSSAVNGAYTLMWLPRSEQREYIREYGNSRVVSPDMD